MHFCAFILQGFSQLTSRIHSDILQFQPDLPEVLVKVYEVFIDVGYSIVVETSAFNEDVTSTSDWNC